jgi:GNAT superfamily N-acetyltransferase
MRVIRILSRGDAEEIYDIINEAAVAYRGHIPADRYHEPYMPKEEVDHEIESMTFFGWQEDSKLVGVMGLQRVKDVTLIRHAYVLTEHQRTGIGERLLRRLKQETKTRWLLVGTWADADWAVKFYAKHGFKIMPNKDELLKMYWDIPQRQIETSVVLGIRVQKSG